MKKWTILFAVLAMAFVSQADIVDGDFASGTLTAAGTSIAGTDNEINNGWYEYDSATAWDIVGGALKRNFASGGNGGRSVAQISSADFAAGDYSFDFDYSWISTDTSGDIWVQLYLYDNISGSSSLSYQDRMDLTGVTQFTTPVSSANFNITELATSGNLIAAGTGGHTSIDFTLLSSMGAGDMIGIRIGSLNAGGQTSATLTFDNFEIVPEPATVGMLGLGSLVALLIRRIRG